MLHLTDKQWRYLLLNQLLPAVLINFLINLGLGWLFFHTFSQVHLWQALSFTVLPTSIAIDLLPTTFFLVFFTSLIVSRQVYRLVRNGQVEPISCACYLCRIGPPRNPVTSFRLAVSITLAVVPATVLVFHWNNIHTLPLWHFITFKSLYAAALAALFTPFVVLTTMAESAAFNDIVKDYLGAGLPAALTAQADFDKLPHDAKGFVLRFLTLMKRSGCPATEINAHMIWLLFTVTPNMLPSAWGGRIPPLTAPNRHKKLDDYVAGQSLPALAGRPVFLDLGCGFPPLTTVDTARRLSDWQVYGIDPSFSRYVVYDADGRYACFDRNGNFQYVQSPARPLNDTPEAVRERFKSLFADLSSRLDSNHETDRRAVDAAGNRLIVNHVIDYETQNLRFIKAGVEDADLPQAQFIRCMNMLLYFEKDVRENMLSKMADRLDAGGLLMVGFNHPFGIYARYAIYEKSTSGTLPREFAFSLDNLRPLGTGPWVTLSRDDRDAALLADVTGAIRSDRQFWPDFDRRVDHLRESLGICKRDAHGFHQFTQEVLEAPPKVMMEKAHALWAAVESDGYKAGALTALRRAGYTAWENQAGDIAVQPPEGVLDAIA